MIKLGSVMNMVMPIYCQPMCNYFLAIKHIMVIRAGIYSGILILQGHYTIWMALV